MSCDCCNIATMSWFGCCTTGFVKKLSGVLLAWKKEENNMKQMQEEAFASCCFLLSLILNPFQLSHASSLLSHFHSFSSLFSFLYTFHYLFKQFFFLCLQMFLSNVFWFLSHLLMSLFKTVVHFNVWHRHLFSYNNVFYDLLIFCEVFAFMLGAFSLFTIFW